MDGRLFLAAVFRTELCSGIPGPVVTSTTARLFFWDTIAEALNVASCPDSTVENMVFGCFSGLAVRSAQRLGSPNEFFVLTGISSALPVAS